ncbi:GNAT family N-acetyltransferase [Pseudomonas sp. B11]
MLRRTGHGALVEKGTGELVGFCGVSPEQVGGVQEANLGYRLARRFWNRGLATEAVRGVLA